jgi:hypothetical protein
VVLAGGVGLSLAVNLAQAQPTAWVQVVAATPSAAFLVAVSMIERRAASPAAGVPAQDGADGFYRPLPYGVPREPAACSPEGASRMAFPRTATRAAA